MVLKVCVPKIELIVHKGMYLIQANIIGTDIKSHFEVFVCEGQTRLNKEVVIFRIYFRAQGVGSINSIGG